MYKKISTLILSFLFPIQCIVCENPGRYLCWECLSHIPVNPINLCPICQKAETFAGRVCNVCENENKKIYLDGVIVASYYKHPVLREAIYRFKYNFLKQLSKPLAKILFKKIISVPGFPTDQFVIIPVPLHPKRLVWRGFNQAELLGKNLQKIFSQYNINMNLITGLLVRQKYIRPQMKIHSTEDRKKNIIGCFLINKESTIKLPEKIILLDDIITTGATLEECAKTLKRRGVRKVWGLVLARQGR